MEMMMQTDSLPRARSWWLSFIHNLWVPIIVFGLICIGRHFEFADRPGPYVMHVAMIAAINIILAVSLQLINGVSGQFSLGHAGFMAVGAYLAGYATYIFAPWNFDPNADYPDPRQLFANPGGTLACFVALAVVAVIACGLIAGLFLLIRQTRKIFSALPLILISLLIAWVVIDARAAADSQTVPAGCIWSRGAIGLVNLYGGILQHSQPASLWLSALLPDSWHKPTTLIVAIMGGGIAAAAAALIVGIPTLRLRGDYLAIATLGFAEIIRNIIVTIPALGAATGLSVNVYATKPSPADHIFEAFYISPWIFGAAALTYILVRRLARSSIGKAIRTVRDDEIAAAAMGIDPTHHRVIAFVTGAFFAGVAGALYVHLDGYLNTNSFSFMRSIEIVVMVTLGGMESLAGAAIAAVALTAIPELLDNAGHFFPAALTSQAHWLADNRFVVYALLVLLIMIARAKLKGRFRIPLVRKPQPMGVA
jgi:ABC-type branched-subunit amino acid transport system permease subunit